MIIFGRIHMVDEWSDELILVRNKEKIMKITNQKTTANKTVKFSNRLNYEADTV